MDRLSRINMLLSLLNSEPNDVFTNYALAIEYASENDFAKAEKQFLRVLEIDKNYLPCFYQLGQLKEKTNNIDVALKFYYKGLELAKTQGNNKAVNEINEAIFLLED